MTNSTQTTTTCVAANKPETVVPILDYDHGIARRVDFGEFSRQTSVGWGH